MPEKHPPSHVFFEQNLFNIYSNLKKGSKLRQLLDKMADILSENMFAGKKIRKKLIPKYYIDRYGVNNLYRFQLNSVCRCCYTLLGSKEGIIVTVLEVFTNHKSYALRFKYKIE